VQLDWKAIAIAALIGGAGGGGTYFGANATKQTISDHPDVVLMKNQIAGISEDQVTNRTLLYELKGQVDQLVRKTDLLLCETQRQAGERCTLSP
jgi:hypothetical protein